MKTQPIQPARVEFCSDPAEPPRSPDYQDIYHPRAGALVQARHVFLGGNQLPARWAGRARFVILETGFGLGNNFLATWQAWRDDPARCERLVFVSVERHPLRHDDLARAHAHSALPERARQLLDAWPPLTPNLHTLTFEGGRVQLLLALGDVALMLPALRLQADAFYLDGYAPARNPQMWQDRVLKALGRRAAPDATLATWSVARDLRAGLQSAGFVVDLAPGTGGKREITVARWAPRFSVRPAQTPLETAAVAPQQAVVIGAGVAGAAAAWALAMQGVQVTVLERAATVAAGASGNRAALFHGTVNADDGPYARLFRAAALQAQRDFAVAMRDDPELGSAHGLLRLDPHQLDLDTIRSLLGRLGLPADYVQALDEVQASARAGRPLASPAWFYPGGGWIEPGRWVRSVLQHPGIHVRCGVEAAQISQHAADGWQVLDATGQPVAAAPLLVLACTASIPRLLQPWQNLHWPLAVTGGQVTLRPGASDAAGTLQMPLAGDGYAIPLPSGDLLCGATRASGTLADMDGGTPPLSADAHRDNQQRLQRLCGIEPVDVRGEAGSAGSSANLGGRTGWRLSSADRLPIAGALPLPDLPPGTRQDQARLLPRVPGLFVLTALGSRGLTLAPLLGRLIAAQATGAPWPLEQDLADAVDPARWQVRAARVAGPTGGG